MTNNYTLNLLLFSFLIFASTNLLAQNFSNVANTANVDHGNAKDGGVAWADFNNDGCLDLIFNTNANNNANRSRLLFSDCSLPNPGFIEMTASHANGIRQNKCERSVSVGDFNNDGYIDFCRNTNDRIEVYLNKGPGATPAYSFGDAAQNPNFVLTAIPGGLNSEGLGWADYDNDGYLDLIIENHNFGIDIYRNPANGTANFIHATPNGDTKGLPTGGTTGDFMTLCDYNDDGNVDILARKEDDFDIWTNTGAGTFISNTTFNEQANNSNKGGVLFCDFDNDGDFDLFWSDQGVNQIFQQTGINSGNFVATNEPAASSGININNNVDGCSCGDVNNDGHIDLFLGGSGVGGSHLFLNNGDQKFTFTLNNLGLTVAGDTEGSSLADYDNDGDLDLYININGAANELWQNDLNNTNYLKVDIKKDLGGGVYRDDLGANVILKDCDGNIVGGIRNVSSVKGHGSNDPAVVHFGLPKGNQLPYTIEVHFTNLAGNRVLIDTTVVPNTLTDQRITLVSSAPSGLGGCLEFFLPIELLYFNAKINENEEVDLTWATTSEINNAYFSVEKSTNGIDWNLLTTIDGAGNSNTIINYTTFDTELLDGTSYYRLVQTDYDGNFSYSETKAVYFESNKPNTIRIYPNPAHTQVTIEGADMDLSTIRLYNVTGQDVTNMVQFSSKNSTTQVLDISNLSVGIYLIKTPYSTQKLQKR